MRRRPRKKIKFLRFSILYIESCGSCSFMHLCSHLTPRRFLPELVSQCVCVWLMRALSCLFVVFWFIFMRFSTASLALQQQQQQVARLQPEEFSGWIARFQVIMAIIMIEVIKLKLSRFTSNFLMLCARRCCCCCCCSSRTTPNWWPWTQLGLVL